MDAADALDDVRVDPARADARPDPAPIGERGDAVHGPRAAALRRLDADVERARAATRRLLLLLIEDGADAAGDAAASSLDVRDDVLTRLVRRSDHATATLGGATPSAAVDTLRHPSSNLVVDRVAASLGATLDAIAIAPRGVSLRARMTTASQHLARLERALDDLGAVAPHPSDALDRAVPALVA